MFPGQVKLASSSGEAAWQNYLADGDLFITVVTTDDE